MEAKEEIRAKLAIEDVIGEYVQLKRAGRNWKGLSPFGSEKTPSFVVSPDKQIWHDFSSGRGGDVFGFIMEMEGVDFKGAMEILARRAGVDLEQYKSAGSGRRTDNKERLYEVLELATRFYQAQFAKSQLALSYVLRKRQFTKTTALEWRLGYAPNNGTALIDFLKKRGFNENELRLAGLTSKTPRGQLQDMFRERLMIPLADQQGRVIGFTARLLADNPRAPKYINTPSTPLYDKSRHVFGLHLAKESIRRNNFVVLAEGNLDVIQSHQADVRNVVATAGTALTEYHLKSLNRLTGDVRLCFDADKAGLAATERALPVAAKAKVSLQVVTIPSGKDPDELIRADAESWRKAITKPEYAVDWLIKQYMARLDVNTAQGKRKLSDVVLEVVRQLPDQVEQDHYLGKLAEILQVNKQALIAKLSGVAALGNRPLRRRAVNPKMQAEKTALDDKIRTEERLIAITLMQRRYRKILAGLDESLFDDKRSLEVFRFLKEHPDFDGTDKSQVKKIAEYGKILALIYETLYQDLDSYELEAEAKRLRSQLVSQYVRIQKENIVAQLRDAEPAEAEQLLTKAQHLDELLRSNQRGEWNESKDR